MQLNPFQGKTFKRSFSIEGYASALTQALQLSPQLSLPWHELDCGLNTEDAGQHVMFSRG